jgi:hypothetical protein
MSSRGQTRSRQIGPKPPAASGLTPRSARLGPVRLRLAVPDDHGALARLAGLDSRRLPRGPHLVAEREGRIDAALSLSTGELVADPFRRTADLCELLRCRARGIRAEPEERHVSPPRLRPRLVPA